MKIIETLIVNEHNTEVKPINGEQKKIMSFRMYPMPDYIGGIFLPDNVNFGDVVSVFIPYVKSEEYNGKTYYKAGGGYRVVPEMNINRELNGGQAPQASMQQAPMQQDPFAGTPMDIADEDLPF